MRTFNEFVKAKGDEAAWYFAEKSFETNPEHKGWCTPMTKKTCTGKRRNFAVMAKRHWKAK